MDVSKITGNTWKAEKVESYGVSGYEIHWSDDGECVTDHVYTKEDAELIAEAGTITNQCGFSPKELLEQRDELLNSIKYEISVLQGIRAKSGWTKDEANMHQRLTVLINKINP